MKKENIFLRIKRSFERFLPMSFGSLILFLLVLYLLFSVGKSILQNYDSNKDIRDQEKTIIKLKSDIVYLQAQIAYYKTNSFRDKQARAKLGYKAPADKVISLPRDESEDKIADPIEKEIEIKTPNYRLWWLYFTN